MFVQDASFRDAVAGCPAGERVDIAVLLPGFFGFTRIGGFFYFAERVGAAIRGAVQARVSRPVPILQCATLPAGSLAVRQAALVEQLVRLIPEGARLHLVGHSAGGVDATLLTCARPQTGPDVDRLASWTRAEERLRRSIASVVTIGAPHRGTTLTSTRLARILRDPRRYMPLLLQVAPLGADLARLLADRAGRERLAAIASGGCDVVRFLRECFRNTGLIDDLAPDRIRALFASNPRDMGVPLRCFVSAVSPDSAGSRFFRDLYEMTAEHAESVLADESFDDVCERLGRFATPIRGQAVPWPMRFTRAVNDGIVNSVCQLPEGATDEELAGVVIADHVDVIGYYPRDETVADEVINESLLKSGAGFRDSQFFELYERVARAIVDSIRTC